MSKRILVLQQSDKEISLLAQHIKETGCEVETTTSAIKAERMISDRDFDLLIVSAILSQGSAYEFCKFVRKSYSKRDLPIIITSVIESGTLALESKTKWGANEFIMLPAPLKFLIKMIQFYVGQNAERPESIITLQMARSRNMRQEKGRKKKFPSRGDLSNLPFSQIIKILGAAKRTGQLIIGEGDEQFTLTGVDGQLVQIQTPFIRELTLAEILVSERLLEMQALDPFIKRLEMEKVYMGHMLLEAGMLKKDQITHALAQQLILKSLLLFDMKSGKYQFQKLKSKPEKDFPFSISVAQLLLERYRQKITVKKFEKLYGQQSDQTPKLKSWGAFDIKDLGLPKDQYKAIKKFNGFITLKDVVEYSNVPAEILMPVVHTLVSLKMIKLN